MAKLPKPRISTRSPLESARVIAAKMSSRISLPSFKVDSQFRAISLESSALVNFPDISSMDTALSAKSSAADNWCAGHVEISRRAIQRAAAAARAGSGSGSPATAG